jgi:hypothetical protein
MHHVTVSEADGSVHMVEVIQNEPGHLDVRPLPRSHLQLSFFFFSFALF